MEIASENTRTFRIIDLTGPTSCRKTKTAENLVNSLNDNGITTLWYSRGDYFRMAGEILDELGYKDLESMDEDAMAQLSMRMGVTFFGYRLMPVDYANGNHTKQTFKNGDLAARYASYSPLQDFINNLQSRELKKQGSAISLLLIEGRQPDGELHIAHDATDKAKTDIRREENGLKEDTTNELIKEERDGRDKNDAAMLIRRPQTNVINVKFNEWSEEADKYVHSHLLPLVMSFTEGKLPENFVFNIEYGINPDHAQIIARR